MAILWILQAFCFVLDYTPIQISTVFVKYNTSELKAVISPEVVPRRIPRRGRAVESCDWLKKLDCLFPPLLIGPLARFKQVRDRICWFLWWTILQSIWKMWHILFGLTRPLKKHLPNPPLPNVDQLKIKLLYNSYSHMPKACQHVGNIGNVCLRHSLMQAYTSVTSVTKAVGLGKVGSCRYFLRLM